MKYFLATLLLFAGVMQAHSSPQDITALIRSLPGVESSVANLCEKACIGNEKRSWLESASLDEHGTLRLEVRLRNKHIPIKGIVLYDDTAHVTAQAILSLFSCSISNWEVKANNDIYDLLIGFFQEDIGTQIAELEDQCRKFFGQ